MYNNSQKLVLTEPSLIVNIVSNAKRYTKTTNYRRRKEPYPLWWNLLNSLVLQKTQTKVDFAKRNPIQSKNRFISPCRVNISNNIYHNSWYKSLEQDKNIAREWSISKDSWFKEIPLCKQSQKISETNQSPNHFCYKQNTRQITIEDVSSSTPQNKYSFRFRFNCCNNLRQTNRRSRSWLQSWQEREAFISSTCMLRIPHKRFLAWNIETRQCVYFFWCSTILAGMSAENSTIYLSYQSTNRFWFFRSQIHKTFRREKDWICNSSQINQNHKRETTWFALSQVQERLVGSGIPIYTVWLEETTSVCGNSQKITKQTTRTTDTIHFRTIFLPGVCNKPFLETRKHMVLLSCPSKHRSSYQRAKTRFFLNKNTDKQIFGKSNVFFFTSFCLQYSQLVQTTLSTTKIKECDIRNNSYRYFCFTGKISQQRTPKYTQITRGIYFNTITGLHYEQNRKTKDHINFAGLQNFQNYVPS